MTSPILAPNSQSIAFVWTDGQSIAASQTDAPITYDNANYEVRSNNELLVPTQFGLLGAYSPTAGLQAVTDGVYLVKAIFTFTLQATIGAFPIVVSSVLYQGFPGDAADSALRDTAYTTLRAGMAGDRFSHSLSYFDVVVAGDGFWVAVTTGSTPILIDGVTDQATLEMGYLGPMWPDLAA